MWPAPAIEYIELVHFENITVEVVKCDHFGKGFGLSLGVSIGLDVISIEISISTPKKC
jgi:hypothetical protein